MTSAMPSFQAVIDPVIRLAQALDDDDHDLFVSALTPDAVCDLTGFNSFIPPPKTPFGVLHGRDDLVEKLLGVVGPNIETTHMLSNFRITRAWKEGDEELREVTNYALAQHYRKGEGHDVAKRGCLDGNRYRCEVVRMKGEVDEMLGEDRWRIRHFAPWNVWGDGDASVMGR